MMSTTGKIPVKKGISGPNFLQQEEDISSVICLVPLKLDRSVKKNKLINFGDPLHPSQRLMKCATNFANGRKQRIWYLTFLS